MQSVVDRSAPFSQLTAPASGTTCRNISSNRALAIAINKLRTIRMESPQPLSFDVRATHRCSLQISSSFSAIGRLSNLLTAWNLRRELIHSPGRHAHVAWRGRQRVNNADQVDR